MPAYLIILLFFLNILFGITFFYSIFLLIFHPRKKRKILFVNLPRGLIYFFKDKILDKITDFFKTYLENNKEEFAGSKPQQMADDLIEKSNTFLKNKVIKFMPVFIKEKIITFSENIIYHFVEELSCSFLPNLVDKYLLKDRIIEIFNDENILFIEQKAKYYLTKPLLFFGAFFGIIFALFNLIILIIFSIL